MNAKKPLDISQLNLADLRKLADFLQETGLEEIELELGEGRVRLKRPTAGAAVTAASAPLPAPAPTANATLLPAHNPAQTFTSPMVGTFYQSPGPEAQPFVKVGDSVKPGQPLCIIEAMKTMNTIESDRAGTIKEILPANATPVEFGQPLFIIA